MKKIIILLVIVASQPGFSQAAEASKSLASSMDVHVFPAEDQTADQQSKDEAECYKWATNKVGTDPLTLSKESAEQAKTSEQTKATPAAGSGASGAIKGAAAGAIIDEITDNNSHDDAKIGAAFGLIRGRKASRNAKKKAAEQSEQKQQQISDEKLKNFKNAFSVCLEAKKYMVKF